MTARIGQLNTPVMDLRLLASVYGIIFIAELPDKTALASLVLATENPPVPVFIGASLALTVQSLLAVAFGSSLSFLPTRPVHVASGVLFLGSAIAMWRRSTDPHQLTKRRDFQKSFVNVFATVFAVVFVAEWGDLTQIGTAALAAHYHAPLTILLGSMLALWTVVAIVVFIGNKGGRALSPEVTKRAAAAVFAIVGFALIAH